MAVPVPRIAHRTFHQAVAHSHEAIIAVSLEKLSHEFSFWLAIAAGAALIAAFAVQAALGAAAAAE